MTQVNTIPTPTVPIAETGDPVAGRACTATSLLVLGMHRSGTSAMARLLNLLGVDLGEDLLPAAPDNEAGFWEHREIQFTHDRIYEDLRRDWTNISALPDRWWERPEIQVRRDQLRRILQRDFGFRSLWGIKDPRLCFMLPLWIRLLAEMDCQPKCVLIFRNPQEIAASLHKRDNFAASRSYLLWLRSVIESERSSRTLPRTLTTYEKLLSDWEGRVRVIGSALQLDWPIPAEQISQAASEFIRPSARHHAVDNTRFLADAKVPEQVRRMYAAVLWAAEKDDFSELSVVVDEIANELELNQPLLVQFAQDLETQSRDTVIARNVEEIRLHGEIGRLRNEASQSAAAADAARQAHAATEQARAIAAEAHAAEARAAQEHIANLTLEQARLLETERKLTGELALRENQLIEAKAEIQMLNANIAADKETIEQKDYLIEQMRIEQLDTTRQIARLTSEYARLRGEITEVYRTRDTLGPSLAKLWKSSLWRWGKPAWLLARAMGKLNVNINQLSPLTEATRGENGSWRGTQAPMLLITTPPLIGWIRVRAKIHSTVPSRAVLYFDTGGAFNQREHFELSPVAGHTEIERMVPLRTQTFCIRFDPIQAPGEWVLESFSLEPMSRFYFNAAAVLRNFKRIFTGKGSHRPSIWIGLKLLFTGNLKLFHRQLVTNVESSNVVSEYDLWQRRNAITDESRRQMRETIAGWENPPTISIITPVYNVPEIYLRKCIESVMQQVYPHWELCIADDASPKSFVKKVLREYASNDPRIKVVYQSKNGGISEASNAALKLASGEYLALLDHDDEIPEHALYKVAEAIVKDRSLDMIYSDEDKLTEAGKRHDPFFKPDWSPEYFLSCMYTCHLGVYRTEIVKKLGGWRKQFDGSQDYDLVLRIIAGNPKIHHIPDVLYHWRTLATSTASGSGAKPEAHTRAGEAIQAYIDAIGRKGKVEDGPSNGFHRVRFDIIGNPKVSIVIPSACRLVEFKGRQTWLVLECVASIRKMSTYSNIEIIVMDDNNEMPDELETKLKALDVRRISFNEPFNFSRKMNLGCFSATGTQLVTMNDDVEIISPDWIQSMLEYSQWPEIGAVGAQLLFPDDTQQHTGVTILEGRPGHPFYHFPSDHPGYFNSSVVHRNWSAVTAACMMTSADAFNSVNGFSEKFPLNYNDVDYCLKLQSIGRRIVYMPYAKLYHHESSTKAGTFAHELEDFQKTWARQLVLDPYYNPNLSMHMGDFRIG
jgi:GT2 family glycosyltransferase